MRLLLRLLADVDFYGDNGLPKTDWKCDSWMLLVALC